MRKVFVADRIRDWKGYLEMIPKRLVGIAGPTAPRVFSFIRREGQAEMFERLGQTLFVLECCEFLTFLFKYAFIFFVFCLTCDSVIQVWSARTHSMLMATPAM